MSCLPPPLSNDFAILNPHDTVCKLGNGIIMCDHHQRLVKFTTRSLQTVSYTHLDVYKRQVQCQRTMTIFKPIVYEQTGNRDRNLLIPYGKFYNRSHIYTNHIFCIGIVACPRGNAYCLGRLYFPMLSVFCLYFLDVYKRQFYFHLLANWKKRLPLYAQYR